MSVRHGQADGALLAGRQDATVPVRQGGRFTIRKGDSMNTVHIARTVAAATLLALLAGCGQGLSGEYGVTNSRGEFEPVMTFRGKDLVELAMGNESAVGQYEVVDGKVYITVDGETKALPIDDKGCIQVDRPRRRDDLTLCKK
jgi:hypothetical protein